MLPVSPLILVSVAVTVIVKNPAVVAVPLSWPVALLSVSPPGRLPEVTAKLYVPDPPVAVRAALKELLAVAAGSELGLMVKLLAGLTTSV